jgi:hypothetical protein
VVPDLRRLVEQLALGLDDDVLETGVLVVGAGYELVERVDVCLVVLAVVVLERLGRQVRLEGIGRVRELGQREGHGGSFRRTNVRPCA